MLKVQQTPSKNSVSNGFEEEINSKENDTPIATEKITNVEDVQNLPTNDKNIDNNFIKISISETTKVGEGMSSYVAYRIVTRTNMPTFKANNMAVLRRFSDFLGLHNKLTEKYLRNGRLIPPAPQKNMLGKLNKLICMCVCAYIYIYNTIIKKKIYILPRFY